MASVGPNSPGTLVEADYDGGSGIGNGWANYANAGASSPNYSQYIKATNFGFSVPTGSTIDGIVVEVERKASQDINNTGYGTDASVLIVQGGAETGTDKADTTTHWPTSDAYKTYGSSSDLWGTSWTVAQINASDFGVSFACIAKAAILGTDSVDFSVDHIRITVYYTAASGVSQIQSTLLFMGVG